MYQRTCCCNKRRAVREPLAGKLASSSPTSPSSPSSMGSSSSVPLETGSRHRSWINGVFLCPRQTGQPLPRPTHGVKLSNSDKTTSPTKSRNAIPRRLQNKVTEKENNTFFVSRTSQCAPHARREASRGSRGARLCKHSTDLQTSSPFPTQHRGQANKQKRRRRNAKAGADGTELSSTQTELN